MFCYEGRAGGVSEGFWKGGMRTFGNFGMEKGEGRREKGEGRMYDLEDCVNVVRERFVLGTSVKVGKVTMRGFTVP